MDKETLFSRPVTELHTAVELSMGTVQVRGLTRAEVEQTGTLDGLDREAATFALAVVDPVMDPEEWLAWFSSGSVGDWTLLSEAVQEASGLGEKEATKSVRAGTKRRRR